MPKEAPFVLTDDLRESLENLPAAEPRSKLEPFRAFILRWRREGRSYRNIQKILASHCGVSVTYETLRKFVELRSRPRKVQPEVEEQPATIAPQAAQRDEPTAAAAPKAHTQLSPDEVAQQRSKPIVVPEVRKRFVYDPDREQLLDHCIKDFYLRPERPSLAALILEVKRQFAEQQLPAPNYRNSAATR